jgi:hypothetical protein
MVAPYPNPRTIQAPPDLPSMPGIPLGLNSYLQNFALWCRHGFADKVSATVAQPASLMQSHDAAAGQTPSIFKFQVNQAGVASLAPMALGTADPSGTGTPIPLVNEAPTGGGVYARSSGGWVAAVSSSGGAFTGPISAPSATISGALSAASAAISGALTSATATLSGLLSGAAATFTGLVTAHSMTFSALPVNAINDAAAATAGVPLGGVYRNGSVLMVRVV